MDDPRTLKILDQIDAIHRELARLTIAQILGTPSALKTEDIMESHPLPMKPETAEYLSEAIRTADSEAEVDALERILFGCIDLTVEAETAVLDDMLRFYSRRCFMHVGAEKIPAVEVVPWLQAETDFTAREEMEKECSIAFKSLLNPLMLAILETTLKTVKERFGFRDYIAYCEAKKRVSLDDVAETLEEYLGETADVYAQRMAPWVMEKLKRPFVDLSRYHALHLVRIRRFDEYFPVSRLEELLGKTLGGLGFDVAKRPDVTLDISDEPGKSSDGLCVGVEIPGETHILLKPVGGLIDVETLLHEAGHAFFLSFMRPDLALPYRRLYRSGALDEMFAFLFMDLIGNRAWLTGVAGMPADQADRMVELYETKKLCLIRRHIGKVLGEKEFHELGDIKNSEPYCRNLTRATGFVYEPEGYLIDRESDFYALDYLDAWSGSSVMARYLEDQFGEAWYENAQAGELLQEIARQGRRNSMGDIVEKYCGSAPTLPTFTAG